MKVILHIVLAFMFVLNGEGWDKVYLASFPRSGNHWVRFLIEEATHIATSSVYRDGDYFHLPSRFPWGAYSTDHGYFGNCRYPSEQDPVVIKTHYPCFQAPIDPMARVSICLIRHPIDAFWSFYTYQYKTRALKNIPEVKLGGFIELWRSFYEFWERQPRVVFIRYEDLLEDTEGYLRLILETAGFAFDETDIKRAVAKHPPREGALKHLDRYDERKIGMIREVLKDLLERYGYDL